jgi:hypothetical protein
MTMILIQTQTLASAAASITFSSIPQDSTDLMLMLSGRLSTNSEEFRLVINGDTGANYTTRRLFGSGSAAVSDLVNVGRFPMLGVVANDFTANTFGNSTVYIPNYAGSNTKTVSADTVTENNAAESYQMLTAGLWNSTAAITSLTLSPPTGDFSIGTTASLYKITKGSDGIVTVS